jgi:uncharacterized protein involved in tellurium resistance
VTVKEVTVNSLIKEGTDDNEKVIGVVAQGKPDNQELKVKSGLLSNRQDKLISILSFMPH